MTRQLTDLEHCVLGVIWRDGPVTAYEIAVLFARSLTPFWSGSAGAIYPLVERLKKRGLVKGAHRAWRGSRRTVLSITPKGSIAMRSWLTTPVADSEAAPVLDSLRTRTFFLDILKPSERAAFLEEATRAVRDQLVLVRKQRKNDEAAGNISEVIGMIGAEEQLEGRLRWLKRIRKLA